MIDIRAEKHETRRAMLAAELRGDLHIAEVCQQRLYALDVVARTRTAAQRRKAAGEIARQDARALDPEKAWKRFCARVKVKSSRPNTDADIKTAKHVVLADGRKGYWCPCHGFETYDSRRR